MKRFLRPVYIFPLLAALTLVGVNVIHYFGFLSAIITAIVVAPVYFPLSSFSPDPTLVYLLSIFFWVMLGALCDFTYRHFVAQYSKMIAFTIAALPAVLYFCIVIPFLFSI